MGMTKYYRIRCPICRHVFLKACYRESLKTASCPYCGYRINLERYPQSVLQIVER